LQRGDVDLARQLLESDLDAFAFEPDTPSKIAALRARLAIETRSHDALELVEAAEELAAQQEAGFWVSYCRVLRALATDDDQDASRILRGTVQSRGSSYLSVLAEPLCRQLHRFDNEAQQLVASEAALRPARWQPPLREAIQRQGDWRSRLAAGRLLEAVGTKQDVALLRQLSRELRSRGVGADLGRQLARRTANRIWVEDQGRVSLVVAGQEVPGTSVRRKALALLCYLLSRPGMAATKDQVLDTFWPESDPHTAANSLNQVLYFLRRTFDADFHEDLSPPYIHCENDMVWIDQELISCRSDLCRKILKEIGPNPEPRDVERLATEYRGRFALDFEYEDWSRAHRDSLHAAYLHIIENAVLSDLATGHFMRGIEIARRALEADPEAEGIEVALIRLYKRVGAHGAAAEQYQHYAATMRDQLGIEPPTLEGL
jgi:DNA-binding SARP family transcriptional activator